MRIFTEGAVGGVSETGCVRRLSEMSGSVPGESITDALKAPDVLAGGAIVQELSINMVQETQNKRRTICFFIFLKKCRHEIMPALS